MKNNLKKITSIIIVISAVFVLSGCGQKTGPTYSIELEIWGIFDDSRDFAEVTRKYVEVNPFIKSIKYRKFSADTYKNELLEALAAGKGPDIFLINNSWMPSFKDITVPSPKNIVNEATINSNFVDVVKDDFYIDGEAYGLPLSVDSLALYYNKSLFNAAGIVSPPESWSQFSEDVRKLTKYDENGNILKYGAALGTASNINRSVDLLALLFFQNGVDIVSMDNKDVMLINSSNPDTDNSGNAGENALNFYTQFANGNSAVYTWDSRAHLSVDAFAEGNVAMMINYSWHMDTIKAKNPKLDFAVSNVPQLSKSSPVNVANYWAYVVPKNKSSIDPETGQPYGDPVAYNNARISESWQFLKYLTAKNNGKIILQNALSGAAQEFAMDIDPAKDYIEKTGKPAARRDLIEVQLQDPNLGPFVFGNINAKSWYRKNPNESDKVLAEMLDAVNRGEYSAYQALGIATSRLSEITKE